MQRRQFLFSVGAGCAAAAAGVTGGGAAAADQSPSLRRRPYGRELSVIGFGGIVVMGTEQSVANRAVAWAVEQGVNYFDVAPSYGNAQDRLGPALRPFREDAFLACKTGRRDAAGAREELTNSLRVLQTEYFDLYQLHGLTSPEEVDRCFVSGGVMETVTHARREGLIRNIGFSAHSVTAALRAMELFDFDSVLFPFNAVCMENGNFGAEVLQRAAERNVACLALKATAWQPWPEGAQHFAPSCWYQPADDPRLVQLLVSYTLDLPVVALLPPGDERLFRLAVQAARAYQPLTPADRAELLRAMAGVEPIFSRAGNH
jgi:diketogulonate reductase-like aldo/keto reductase